jgi:hypothetical protein
MEKTRPSVTPFTKNPRAAAVGMIIIYLQKTSDLYGGFLISEKCKTNGRRGNFA